MAFLSEMAKNFHTIPNMICYSTHVVPGFYQFWKTARKLECSCKVYCKDHCTGDCKVFSEKLHNHAANIVYHGKNTFD